MGSLNGSHTSSNGSSCLLELQNENLKELEQDTLYHLNLDNRNHDLPRMFGDVRFVIMGGCSRRMKKFAQFVRKELNVDLPAGVDIVNITEKANRYTMYKVGPVISVSHGIGAPSLSILLQELFKLLHYAKCQNVTFIRIGTCGLLGLKPGSLVITNKVYDNQLRTAFEKVCLGQAYHWPADFNQALIQEIKSIADTKLHFDNVFLGGTMACNDFYEEQGRMDGPTCRFTKQQRIDFLKSLQSKGIMNIEMEAMTFAGLCRLNKVDFAVICVGILDRLESDQVRVAEGMYEQFTDRLFVLVSTYISQKLKPVPSN